MRERKKTHYWFSWEQERLLNDTEWMTGRGRCCNTTVINSKRIAYTQCGSNKRTSGPNNLKDAIYLGSNLNFWEHYKRDVKNWHKYIPKRNSTKHAVATGGLIQVGEFYINGIKQTEGVNYTVNGNAVNIINIRKEGPLKSRTVNCKCTIIDPSASEGEK